MSNTILKAYEKRQRRESTLNRFFTYYSFAYLLMHQEREQVTLKFLHKLGIHPLTNIRILDVGCGNGNGLREMLQAGAAPNNLAGIDIRPEPLERAIFLNPTIAYLCGSATALPWDKEFFDLCLCYTVFSSVLDSFTQEAIVREIERVLRPGGVLLYYDFRYNNPRNPDVRGITKQRIYELFPHFQLRLQTVTLAPPLARRLGYFTPLLYPVLSAFPFLRTHYLGILHKI